MKLTLEEKAARKEDRKQSRIQARETARIESERNQKPVKELTITVEWKKSRAWGANPHASAQVNFADGSFSRDDSDFTCSGCGYDKESTVIAQVFNKYLKYRLWAMNINRENCNNGSMSPETKIPYGIVCYSSSNPHYSGGIGTSCYYDISKHIGGKFEKLASGKNFDVYRYTDGFTYCELCKWIAYIHYESQGIPYGYYCKKLKKFVDCRQENLECYEGEG